MISGKERYRHGCARLMEIKVDDLGGPKIQLFLKDHLEDMARHSPPESIHALGLEGCSDPRSPSGASGMTMS
jgi:hypothetical protein